MSGGRTASLFAFVVLLLILTPLGCREPWIALPTPATPRATASQTRSMVERGTIVEGMVADAQNLNPILWSDDASNDVGSKIFEGLVTIDPFTGAIIPCLAESWDISPDGLTYTFHLRDGIFWHDGQPFTARDVKFTLDAIASDAVQSPLKDNVSLIEQVNIADERTIEVTFSDVNCTALFDLLLGIIPEHAFPGGLASINDSKFSTTAPVGTGPYMFQEWVGGDHITLSKNPRYWRGAPYIETWVHKIAGNSSLLPVQLTISEIDIASVPIDALREVQSSGMANTFERLADGYVYLGLQNDHPILSDKRVRQAIAYAIDAEAILEVVAFGQGVLLNANVLPAMEWAHNAELQPRSFDPSRAVTLLEEAGWTDTNKDGTRDRNGQPLHLRLTTSAGSVYESVAPIVREQLAGIGLSLELDLVEESVFLDRLLGQEFEMVIAGWTNLGPDPYDGQLWHSANDVPGWGLNFVSFHNQEVDRLFDEARSLPGCDQESLGEIYRQVQEILYDEQPYVWLYVPKEFTALSRRIRGANPGPWSIYHNVHEWFIEL